MTACALALAVPTGGLGSTADASPVPGTTAQVRGDVSEDADRVDRWARDRFPGHYAGLDTTDGRITVFRVPSAEFDDGLRGMALSTETVVRDAPFSNRDLEALASRVVADIGYWKGEGIEVMAVGARHDGTAVAVGSPQAGRLAPLLPGRYGTAPPAVAEQLGPVAPAS